MSDRYHFTVTVTSAIIGFVFPQDTNQIKPPTPPRSPTAPAKPVVPGAQVNIPLFPRFPDPPNFPNRDNSTVFRETFETTVQAGKEFLLEQYFSEITYDSNTITSLVLIGNNQVIVLLNLSKKR